MQPKEVGEPELNLRLSNAEVNPDLFFKTDSAFYAFAKASMNQPSISQPVIGRTQKRNAQDKAVPCQAIPAKTLNLMPEKPSAR